MLPTFLQPSYKQYKEDSDFVAAWLARSAQRCGYPKDLLVSQNEQSQKAPKLRGRARKLARDAANQSKQAGKNEIPGIETNHKSSRYLIAIGDFITLAEWIAKATKPTIKVPLSFVSVLDRAITVRKRHHLWWSRPGDVPGVVAKQKAASNEKHQFFIDVLEKVREILRPRMPAEILSDISAVASADTLPNLFSGLSVEQPSEVESLAPDTQSAQTPASASSPPDDEYAMKQEDDIEEVYFAVHCLFNDLDNIRRYLGKVWEGYKAHAFDLVAASITTNTAIEFAQRLQEDFIQTFPQHTDFEKHINILYVQQCLAQNQEPQSKERLDDEMNFNVYTQVEPLMFPTYMLLSSFTDVVEPGILPMLKPGHCGTYDPSSDRDSKTARDKFTEDKIVLLEILPDFCALAQHRDTVFAEDELTRGLRELVKTKVVQIWVVFATQIFLDIHHILRDRVADGFIDLNRSAKYVEVNIKQVLEFHKNLRVDTWPRSNDQILLQILGLISDWVKADKVAEIRTWITRHEPLQVALTEPFRLLRQHPMYCGLLSYSIKTLAVDGAITFANACGAVMYRAHLYNAVRQERLLTDIWEDMNLVLVMHDTDRMFVGGFPNTCEDYFKRFCLAMGYSAANFAKNRRSKQLTASQKGPRGLNDLAPVSSKFKDRFCHGEERANLLPADIQAILDEHGDTFEDIESDDGSSEWYKPTIKINVPDTKDINEEQSATSETRKRASKTKPSVASGVEPIVILNALLQAIQSEAMELTFNHFRLHTLCCSLLRAVQQDLANELREIYGAGYLEKENQLPWVVGYIFMTASQTTKLAGFLLPKKKEIVTSKLRAKAAKSMKTWLDSGVGRIELAMLKTQSGVDVEMYDAIQDASGAAFQI